MVGSWLKMENDIPFILQYLRGLTWKGEGGSGTSANVTATSKNKGQRWQGCASIFCWILVAIMFVIIQLPCFCNICIHCVCVHVQEMWVPAHMLCSVHLEMTQPYMSSQFFAWKKRTCQGKPRHMVTSALRDTVFQWDQDWLCVDFFSPTVKLMLFFSHQY